jgi:23S rRNA (cytidine1920-2'-O)/16S rRNA (cytidine1409-2'-O)-methyltransferase
VKPQFELGPERVGGGGVVRDSEARRDALRAVAEAAGEAGLVVRDFASSRLPGPKGNLETFIWCSWTGERVDVEAAIREVES